MRLHYSFNVCHKRHKQTFKNEKWFEEKGSTINITVMLGINVTGHQKLKSLVVESSKNATSFKDTQSLEVKYAFNRKYRMTTKIYEKCVQNIEEVIKCLLLFTIAPPILRKSIKN